MVNGFDISSVVGSHPDNGTGKSVVRMDVFDVTGKLIANLVNESLSPGSYEVDWPACQSLGAGRDATNYSSGVYFYKLITNGFSETKRMVLLK